MKHVNLLDIMSESVQWPFFTKNYVRDPMATFLPFILDIVLLFLVKYDVKNENLNIRPKPKLRRNYSG